MESLAGVAQELAAARLDRGQKLTELARQLQQALGADAVRFRAYDEQEKTGWMNVKLADGREWKFNLSGDQDYCQMPSRDGYAPFADCLHTLTYEVKKVLELVRAERDELAQALSGLDEAPGPAEPESVPVDHRSRLSSFADPTS